MKKYFGDIRMTWPRVIALAVITAVYTALINQVPALEDTSLRDIAVTLECWFLFAVFIIVNCRKWQEAALKCFVFFLISQPLIYLIEVPFYGGWGIFQYYRYWLKITVLTLPGAAIAFLVKKKNWLSVLILSVATGYLAVQGVTYLRSAIFNFPYHLLSSLFCFALAIFFIFVLLDEKKHRAAALAVFAAILIGCAVFTFGARLNRQETIELGTENWSYELADGSIADVTVAEDGQAQVKAVRNGNTELCFRSENGEEDTYYISVINGSLFINRLE